MNEYELYHHGVKGMKWGVRKKQTMNVYDEKTDTRLNSVKTIKGSSKSKNGVVNSSDKSSTASKTNKAINVGATVSAGLFIGSFGTKLVTKLGYSHKTASLVGAALGIYGARKYYDLIKD